MSDSDYTDEEKLILFMNGELEGKVLSDFKVEISERPTIQRLLSNFDNLDKKMLASPRW